MNDSEKRTSPQAVAIRYKEEDRDKAPRVVAKGTGHVAETILAVAKQQGVPVYKNKTLVSMLMAVELDREIPAELYHAVAEVLAHIYRIDQSG